jgi:hypothetical protein
VKANKQIGNRFPRIFCLQKKGVYQKIFQKIDLYPYAKEDGKMSENENKKDLKKESDTSSTEDTTGDKESQEEKESTLKPKKKYVFNCTKCGSCC